VCDPAQKNWMKKSQSLPFGSGKWFWLSIKMHSLRWLVKSAATQCTCRKECNKYDLAVTDWPIIIIGPGGLLLVVPHLFGIPV